MRPRRAPQRTGQIRSEGQRVSAAPGDSIQDERSPANFLLIGFIGLAALLGGSSVSFSTYVLQALSAIFVVILLIRFRWSGVFQADPMPQSLGVGYLSLIVLHLVPLPPELWSTIPGRQDILEGYILAGEPPPWLPISLDPSGSFAALLGSLPIICIVLLAGRARHLPLRQASVALLLMGVFSLLLGIAQAKGGQQPFLFIQEPNFGTAAGFFSNPNHLATFFLICLPLFAALAADWAPAKRLKASLKYSALAGLGLLFTIGIIFTNSLAGLLLLLPTMVASYALLRPGGRAWIALGALACVLVAFVTVTSGWEEVVTSRTSFGTDPLDRIGIAATTGEGIQANLPVGSGMGSFRYTYRLYEDLAGVSHSYVNRAHNEYLDISFEAGIPGIILIIVFVGWWLWRSFVLWRSTDPNHLWPRAASVVVGIILLHSVVDYPARMPAILVIMAFYSLAMIKAAPTSLDGSTRHLSA